MRKRFAVLAVLSFVLVLAANVTPAYAQRDVVIKIGTVAPKGTPGIRSCSRWARTGQRFPMDG